MSPVQFYEPSDGSASTIDQEATLTAYCTASDVASLDKSIALGQGQNPTLTDVEGYIVMVAGEIDATLLKLGISIPVNVASNPEAGNLLNSINAKGAWSMLEDAAPAAQNRDRAKKAYDEALALLSGGMFAADAPSDQDRAKIRAPFQTYQPPGGVFDPVKEQLGGFRGDGISAGAPGYRRRLPFFSRAQRF